MRYLSASMMLIVSSTLILAEPPALSPRQDPEPPIGDVPPTSEQPPISYACGAPWERTCCACIGRGIDQLPSTGIVVHPGRACYEAACDNAPGGDTQITWCNDNDFSVAVDADTLRRRFADIGLYCSQFGDVRRQCAGQTFYDDGTNVIATAGCGNNPPLYVG